MGVDDFFNPHGGSTTDSVSTNHSRVKCPSGSAPTNTNFDPTPDPESGSYFNDPESNPKSGSYFDYLDPDYDNDLDPDPDSDDYPNPESVYDSIPYPDFDSDSNFDSSSNPDPDSY
ncbi:unnamed protein product [Prunus brigantina]